MYYFCLQFFYFLLVLSLKFWPVKKLVNLKILHSFDVNEMCPARGRKMSPK
jgi:hypothetical protein